MTSLVAILALALCGSLVGHLVLVRQTRRLDSQLEKALRQLEMLQTAFNRFTPDSVVDAIVAEGLGTTAEKKEVTVLFADLVGFTSMSDRLDPALLVEVLNGYFEEMSAAIGRHEGRVSKFIGDGILAVFGAVRSNPWQAQDAVEAAIEMRQALASYNGRLPEAVPRLKFGVGLHRGEVVVGIVGSQQLMEFTVIGDVVNVASRVEGLTRQHAVDILVTSAVKERLDARFELREMPAVPVKGKPEPVRTWAVVGHQASA